MTNNILRRDLNSSLSDGLFFSFMVGIAESYLAAFILYMGFSAVAAGLVGSLPLVVGAGLQLFAPVALRFLQSYKRLVVICAATQAASLLLLALAAWFQSPSIVLIFCIVAIYWGMGMATGPAWNAWMGELVPYKLRTSFFAKRLMVCHLFLFLGQISGGLALEWLEPVDRKHQVFAGLFLVAAGCRFVSTGFLSRQRSVPANSDALAKFSIREALKLFNQSSLKRIFIFLVFLQSAVYLAAGFFNPYMLDVLKLDFLPYMILVTSAYFARVMLMPLCRKMIARHNPNRILMGTTLGMAITPVAWIASKNYAYLMFLQAAGGFCWGLYELLIFMILFNNLKPREKTQLLTLYNLFQTVAIVMGALVGAWFFQLWGGGATLQSYYWIFTLSAAARFCGLFFIPGFRLAPVRMRDWIWIRPLSVRTFGVLGRPIILKFPGPTQKHSKPPLDKTKIG